MPAYQMSAQPGGQEELASRRIRGIIFRCLGGDARSGIKLLECNIEQAALQRIFKAGEKHVQVGQEDLLSDPEEDTEEEDVYESEAEEARDRAQLVGLQEQVLLTSFADVQDFAAFHDLALPDKEGPCLNSKVLRRSGEVAVLVPPLIATWHRTAEGVSKTVVCFGWAFLNAAGMVTTTSQLESSHICISNG